MKKLIAIVLTILFAANVSGASVSFHYCGKLFQYFAFNGQKKKSKCCCGGTQKKKGCCHTKHSTVKVEKEQSVSAKIFVEKQMVACAVPVLFLAPVPDFIPRKTCFLSVPLAKPPPFARTVPIYLQIRQFLI